MFDLPLHARQIERKIGHITRRQLLDLGCTGGWIDHRIQTGELIPVHLGVYAVGHVPKHAHARSLAAVLTCGDGAALSHAAAAALWAFSTGRHGWKSQARTSAAAPASEPIARQPSRPGTSVAVTASRSPAPPAPSSTSSPGSPTRACNGSSTTCASPATSATPPSKTCAHDRTASTSSSATATPDAPPAPASRTCSSGSSPATTCRCPEINADLKGREVDALYRAEKLIVEVDSWLYHRDHAAFERDRAKDTKALAAGYLTVCTTDRRMKRGGGEEAADIRRNLARAGANP